MLIQEDGKGNLILEVGIHQIIRKGKTVLVNVKKRTHFKKEVFYRIVDDMYGGSTWSIN